MGKTRESKTSELRKLELLRLDELQEVAWRFAMAGQLTGIDRVLKIMERRAKLLGLDAKMDKVNWRHPEEP